MSIGHPPCRSATRLLPAFAAAWLAAPAAAALPEIAMPANLSAVLDLRLAGADGERSWLDGGFGKARPGGDDGGFEIEPLAAGTLVWRPPISWDLSGTVAISAQHGQEQPIDIAEAFLAWRPVPRGATRFSVRAGLFWPPVSLEHDGPAWSVADMITPSAINSWIGEEVKTIAIEGSAARDFGSSRAVATFALFGANDTAGTLLAFRGWALHDQKATLFSDQPLPLLNPFMQMAQAPVTKPHIEIDGRPGFYGRLSWQMGAPATLEAFYYDNRGDPEAVTDTLQWGWRTRFLSVGARIDFGGRTRFLAQALTGTTAMGPEVDDRYWVETRFRSAYARLTHEVGRVALSGRLDLFDTRETGVEMDPGEGEEGWALTGAVDWHVSDQVELLVEALHIDSDRRVRARLGASPSQEEDIIQAAFRLTL